LNRWYDCSFAIDDTSEPGRLIALAFSCEERPIT